MPPAVPLVFPTRLRAALERRLDDCLEEGPDPDDDEAVLSLTARVLEELEYTLREHGEDALADRIARDFGSDPERETRLRVALAKALSKALTKQREVRADVGAAWVLRRFEEVVPLRWEDDVLELPAVVRPALLATVKAAVVGQRSSVEATRAALKAWVDKLNAVGETDAARALVERGARLAPALVERFQKTSPFREYEEAKRRHAQGAAEDDASKALLAAGPPPHDGSHTQGAVEVLELVGGFRFSREASSASVKAIAAEAPPWERTRRYRPGDALSHPTFGHGLVERVVEKKIYVRFESGELKALAHAGLIPPR